MYKGVDSVADAEGRVDVCPNGGYYRQRLGVAPEHPPKAASQDHAELDAQRVGITLTQPKNEIN